jgi:hypothetical protein
MVTIINNALLYNTNTSGNNTGWWFQIFYFLLPTTHTNMLGMGGSKRKHFRITRTESFLAVHHRTSLLPIFLSYVQLPEGISHCILLYPIRSHLLVLVNHLIAIGRYVWDSPSYPLLLLKGII